MPSRGLPSLARRILFRLERAEQGEPNVHFRDDYRISWITVLRAARGESRPHLSATITVLGCHPDQVWPHIVTERRVKLGPLYESFYGEGVLAPKKPPASVRCIPQNPQRAERAA